MKTDLNKISRNIRNNISWCLIFGAIVLFANPNHTWKTIDYSKTIKKRYELPLNKY